MNATLDSSLPDRAPGPNTGTHESEIRLSILVSSPFHLLVLLASPRGSTAQGFLRVYTLSQEQQRVDMRGRWGTRQERGGAARWRAHRGLQSGRGGAGWPWRCTMQPMPIHDGVADTAPQPKPRRKGACYRLCSAQYRRSAASLSVGSRYQRG